MMDNQGKGVNRSPCLGCTERAIGCHSHCEKYQAAKTERIAMCKWKREQNRLFLTRPEARAPKSRKPQGPKGVTR